MTPHTELLDEIFDWLTHFVAKTVKDKKIAGSKSELSADLILTKYEPLSSMNKVNGHQPN